MKKIIVMLLFFFCLVSTANAHAALNNSPTGFRNIKWGESVAKLGKYKLIEKNTPLLLYVKLNDKLEIGTTPLKKIVYVFCAKNFMGVTLEFSNKYRENMIKTLIAKYGQPTLEKPHINSYVWLDDNAFISLEDVPGTRLSRTNIASRKETDRMDTIQQQNAEKAINDF